MMNRGKIIISTILLFSVILTSYAIDDQMKTLYGLELKVGLGGERETTPYGIGSNFRMRFILDDMKAGAEMGLLVTSNWEDTLDLSDSPDPEDTLLYDIWINRGTDVSIIVGPRLSYEVLGSSNLSGRIDIGFGTLFNISSYDDIKKPLTGSQEHNVSEIDSDVEFYFRPRIELQYIRLYLAYEYFFAENIEHSLSLGLMFF